MNRSILIIICDFLLLSLLTFSTDLSKVAGTDESRPVKMEIAPKPPETENSGKDLTAVMKMALTDEQKSRAQLQEQLAKAREITGQQQALLNQRDQQTRQLEQQVQAAQSSLKNVNQQLQVTAAQVTASKEQLAASQAAAQQQADQAAALKKQLDELAKNNAATQAEKDKLATQLQFATEKAQLMQQQVQAERDQNLRLAESFKALATNSSALTQEIRANQELTPNTIFSSFLTNQIQTTINGNRPGVFGTATDTSATKTVLVTDGSAIYALCEVSDTPLQFRDRGTDWDSLNGTLARNGVQVPIHSLSFAKQDPRVIFMPVSPADAARLGGQIYKVSPNPYKFQDAVLIGAQGDYYGQCSFQMDTSLPQYLKLDRSLLKGLFGKFNPSRGDLVFSRSGDLLGIMVNDTYCLLLGNFQSAATFPFGKSLKEMHTSGILSGFYFQIFQSPLKLQ